MTTPKPAIASVLNGLVDLDVHSDRSPFPCSTSTTDPGVSSRSLDERACERING
jgi:hypothetical protein